MAYQITEYTYGSAIQEICRMVGYPIPADAAGSSDSAVQQMGASINLGLTELLSMFEWQDLTIRASLSIVAAAPGDVETGFALPDDFYRFVDQTQWGAQSMLPAMGPVSNQSWMTYIVRSFFPQLSLTWQIRGDMLYVLNAPYPTPVDFDYMYISMGQVVDQDVPTTLKNVATKNGDSFILDSNLVLLLGRVKWLEWKGFDSAAAQRDFLLAFSSRTGANKGAPILNVGRPTGLPLINNLTSVPDTGYGS